MKENKLKNDKLKNGIYIVVILFLGKFLMSDFAYNNILKYDFANIVIDVLMLILVGFALKKAYNRNINKYITIITFSAIAVLFLYVFALSTGIYYSPALKVIKEMKILGAVAGVALVIYIIQYIKVKKSIEE